MVNIKAWSTSGASILHRAAQTELAMEFPSKQHLSSLHRLLLLLLCLSGAPTAHSLEPKGQASDTFYFAFPANTQYWGLTTVRVHITTRENETVPVSISAPNYHTRSVTVPPRGVVNLDIPNNLTVKSITDLNKAIKITTQGGKKISVFLTNFAINSAGAFKVLPLYEYSTSSNEDDEYVYYVVSSSGNRLHSEAVLVSGSHPATNVTLTPTRRVTLPPALTGLSDNLVVHPNESYQFTMTSATTVLLQSLEDLTGTKVTSDAPIALISGHECANIPTGQDYCDHFIHQIPPTLTWGTQFMSRGLTPGGSLYKFIAAENDTTVVVTCSNSSGFHNVTSYSLGEGELEEFTSSHDKLCSLVSNRRILVVQYGVGVGNSSPVKGHPLSIVHVPLEQYATPINPFFVPQTSFFYTGHTIQAEVFVKTSNMSELSKIRIVHNNNNVSNYVWSPVLAGNITLGYTMVIPDLVRDDNEILFFGTNLPPMSVLAFGYSYGDAFGFGLESRLEAISYDELLLVNFSMERYVVSERTTQTLSMIRSNRLDEDIDLQLRGCSNTVLPDNFAFSSSFIEFSEGAINRNVNLTITNDNELSHVLSCYCIELVQPRDIFSLLRPYSTTTVCVQDNEPVSLVPTKAVINSTLLTLLLSLTGYNGTQDQKVTVQPKLNGNQLGVMLPTLPSFNLYITKYLSTYSYTLSLSQELQPGTLLYIELQMPTSIGINTTSPDGLLGITYVTSSSLSSTTLSPTSFITAIPPSTGSILENSELFYSFLSITVALIIVIFILVLMIIFFAFRLWRQRKRASTTVKITEDLEASIKSQNVKNVVPMSMTQTNRNSYSSAADSIEYSSNGHLPIHSRLDTSSPVRYSSVSPPSCHTSHDKLIDGMQCSPV